MGFEDNNVQCESAIFNGVRLSIHHGYRMSPTLIAVGIGLTDTEGLGQVDPHDLADHDPELRPLPRIVRAVAEAESIDGVPDFETAVMRFGLRDPSMGNYGVFAGVEMPPKLVHSAYTASNDLALSRGRMLEEAECDFLLDAYVKAKPDIDSFVLEFKATPTA